MFEKIKNLTRREQVILVLMAIAIGYAIVTLMMDRGSGGEGAGGNVSTVPVNVAAITNNFNAVLGDAASAEADAYIIASAAAEWQNDPFYVGRRSSLSDMKVDLQYTGYIEYAGRKVAVVNGVDYQTGDELEMGGYVVKRITPSEVVIKDKGHLGEMTIPFQEEE